MTHPTDQPRPVAATDEQIVGEQARQRYEQAHETDRALDALEALYADGARALDAILMLRERIDADRATIAALRGKVDRPSAWISAHGVHTPECRDNGSNAPRPVPTDLAAPSPPSVEELAAWLALCERLEIEHSQSGEAAILAAFPRLIHAYQHLSAERDQALEYADTNKAERGQLQARLATTIPAPTDLAARRRALDTLLRQYTPNYFASAQSDTYNALLDALTAHEAEREGAVRPVPPSSRPKATCSFCGAALPAGYIVGWCYDADTCRRALFSVHIAETARLRAIEAGRVTGLKSK